MTLLCKPGDLARFHNFRERSNNEGKIVRVVELHPFNEKGPAWVTDPPLPLPFGGVYASIFDEYLIPLADPEDDEQDCRDILVDRPLVISDDYKPVHAGYPS